MHQHSRIFRGALLMILLLSPPACSWAPTEGGSARTAAREIVARMDGMRDRALTVLDEQIADSDNLSLFSGSARAGLVRIDTEMLNPLRSMPREFIADFQAEFEQPFADLKGLLQADEAPGLALTFDLFDDTSLSVVLDNFLPSFDGEGIVWTGSIQGDAAGEVVLSMRDDLLAATFRTGAGETYEIQPAANGQHLVVQTGVADGPGDLEPITPEAPEEPQPGLFFDLEGPEDDGSSLDVLIALTTTAEQELGGPEGARAKVGIVVESANQALRASRVEMGVNVVDVITVDFDDSLRPNEASRAYFTRILTALPQGAAFDEVRAKRDAGCADAVSLWIRHAVPDVGGLAWGPRPGVPPENFETWAFSVVSHRWAETYYSFAHELAHNFGARHDRRSVQDPQNTLYQYAYGFSDPVRRLGTLMARRCPAGEECYRRVNLLSNPDIDVDGVSVGNHDTSDNQRTFENTRRRAANWRRSC